MTKLESIVVSNTEPNSKNVLWYDNKRLLIFSNGHWSPIVDLDDIDVDNLPNVSNLQEALKSLNIKVDNKVDKVELNKALTAKQDKLVNSDDVTIGIDNKLTVTDLAKKKAFIDQCKTMGAVYNDATGYFELNGLVNITTEQMRHIFNNYGCMKTIGRLPDGEARTNIAELVYSSYNPNPNYGFNLYNKFLRFSKIEVIVLASGEEVWPINIDRAFSGCLKLKKIIGTIRLTDYQNLYKSKSTAYAFENCSALEEVRLKVDGKTVEQVVFSGCPRLSIASIEFLVSNSANTVPTTVTLHPDVYAKLTGDTTNAAASALTSDELAQWQALVTTANSKNISFATTSN